MASQGLKTIRTGAVAGLIGGVCIWIYEAVVWVQIQHQMPLAGIPANAVGLVFGKAVQTGLGLAAYGLGTAIHFTFAMIWGVLFALVWPFFRRRHVEATLAALFYAAFAWVVMHAAIAAVSTSHPDYTDSVVIIGGLMSHIVFAVPLALWVKRSMASAP
jgi:hypothetical protein